MSEFVDAFLGPGRIPGTRASVRSTTRVGGLAVGSRATLGLGVRDPAADAEAPANRARLVEMLDLPAEPVWLQQMHGRDCVELTGREPRDTIQADGAWTARPGVVCAMLTADCLPVALVDRRGGAVAIAHAGWRGLAGGVIEATVAAMPAEPADLHVWLGPAIGPAAFEVGPDVRDAFTADDPGAARAFRAGEGDRWHADLYALARRRLHALGVGLIEGGGACTVSDPERFFSHRGSGGAAGRMATLVWLEPGNTGAENTIKS